MLLSVAAALTGDLGALPTIKKTRVFHVGFLDQPRTYDRTTGNEADGLAVSEHPEEWIRIARLGGHPTWELTSKRGLFVDVIKVLKNKKKLQALRQWGTQAGLVEPGEVWVVSWYDEEEDGRVSTEFQDEREAQEEYESREDQEAEIEKRTDRVHATAKFNAWWHGFTRRQKMDSIFVDEMLAYVFAEASGQYDGVWWKEILDPDRLSAPRGSIFQKQINSWTKKKITDPEMRKPS